MAQMVDIKIEGGPREGTEEIFLNLNLATKTIGDGYVEGLEKATKFLFDRTQEVVPVDTTALKRSGYYLILMAPDKLDATSLIAYDTPYAVYVHEMMHLRHEPPTTAKYIERPARENRHYMHKIIRREIERKMAERLKASPFRGVGSTTL